MFGDNFIDKNMTKKLCKKWFLIKCYPSMLKSLLNDGISGNSVKVHVQIEALHIETLTYQRDQINRNSRGHSIFFTYPHIWYRGDSRQKLVASFHIFLKI